MVAAPQWEESFEHRFGFWRGAIEDAVFAFLDCGIYEHGFARVVCNDCRAEFLVAFSCQRRGLCPSCAAKRGAPRPKTPYREPSLKPMRPISSRQPLRGGARDGGGRS